MFDEDFAIAVLTIVFVCSVAGFASIKLTEKRCLASWERSGFPVRYGWPEGCQIDPDKDGRWIPASAYRAIP